MAASKFIEHSIAPLRLLREILLHGIYQSAKLVSARSDEVFFLPSMVCYSPNIDILSHDILTHKKAVFQKFCKGKARFFFVALFIP